MSRIISIQNAEALAALNFDVDTIQKEILQNQAILNGVQNTGNDTNSTVKKIDSTTQATNVLLNETVESIENLIPVVEKEVSSVEQKLKTRLDQLAWITMIVLFLLFFLLIIGIRTSCQNRRLILAQSEAARRQN